MALRGRELELARVQRIGGGVGGLEVDLAHGFRSQREEEGVGVAWPGRRRPGAGRRSQNISTLMGAP